MSNLAIGPLLCGGFLMLAATAFSVAPSDPAVAQQATPPYGAPISLEQAKKVIAAAEGRSSEKQLADGHRRR